MTEKKRRSQPKQADKAPKKKIRAKRRKPRKASPRQAKLIQGIHEGKSVRRAAFDAGYSDHSANHAAELLSSEVLRKMCQKRLSLNKVLLRIDEGMDATASFPIVLGPKANQKVEVQTYPNYSERRKAAALAARLIGLDPSAKIEIEGGAGSGQNVTVRFTNVSALQEA